MTKLFDMNNPNNQALVIPQQQGGTDDDNYFGSIGDATMRHVFSLTDAERQIWEQLIHTRNGNIFRSTPSFNANDRDPMSLKGRDLDEYIKEIKEKAGSKLDETGLAAIKEAFEMEAERREQSEDAYDHVELIPYHLMEQFPGMEKHIDIPTTPRDHLLYMGNTKQSFYDSFPEGHPEAGVISQFMNMLNRDEADSGYYDWVRERLDDTACKSYIRQHLHNLITALQEQEGDANDLMEDCLSAIDDCWHIEYKNQAAARHKNDRILHLLLFKEKEWEESADQGFNVYSAVKTFGRVLFDLGNEPADETGRKYRRVKAHHWARYRRAKALYAPRVISRGWDINRCNLSELRCALQVSYADATKVFCARPFENLGQLYSKKFIKAASFADNEVAVTVIEKLEQAGQESMEAMDMSSLSLCRQKATQLQSGGKSGLDYHDWRMVWSYYRILRDEVTRSINEQRKESEKDEL